MTAPIWKDNYGTIGYALVCECVYYDSWHRLGYGRGEALSNPLFKLMILDVFSGKRDLRLN